MYVYVNKIASHIGLIYSFILKLVQLLIRFGQLAASFKWSKDEETR